MSSSPPVRLVYNVRREHQNGSLVADETVHWPGERLPPHVHSRGVLFILLEGSATHGFGECTCALVPGTVVFVPANTPHSLLFSGSVARVYSLEIDAQEGSQPLPANVIHSSRPQLVGLMMQSYRLFADESADAGPLGELLQQLAAVDATRKTVLSLEQRGSWLPKVFNFIASGRSKSVRLSLIARAVGRHPAHVSRRFREVFGESMINTRKQARLAAAGRALLDRDDTVSAIAAELGFADHAHLTRSFRRATRMSPTEFRDVVEGTGLPAGAERDPRHAGISELVPPLTQVQAVSA